jgi:signal transduction histidine kinase
MHPESPEANGGASIPVLLTRGRDGAAVGAILEDHHFPTTLCGFLDELLQRIDAACGPVVVGDEALQGDDLNRFLQVLDKQPIWSDLPVILLKRRGSRINRLHPLISRRSVNLLSRPVKVQAFIALVRAALDSRLRQFIVRDLLSELRQKTKLLHAQRTHLRRLSIEVTVAEIRERQRIARLLHDDLQQTLAYVKLQAESLRASVNDETSANRVQTIVDGLQVATQSTRTLSRELNPKLSTEEDLGEALQALATRMAERFSLSVVVEVATDLSGISNGIKNFLHRAVRELLFNCVKHAESENVVIRLTRDEGGLDLLVTDDGMGFPTDRLTHLPEMSTSMGLADIQRTAEAMGGAVDVQNIPKGGSRIAIHFPSRLVPEPAPAGR